MLFKPGRYLHWLTNKLAQTLHCAVALAALSLHLLPLLVVVPVALPLPIVTLAVSLQPLPAPVGHPPARGGVGLVVPHMSHLAVAVSFLPVVEAGGM